MTAAVLACCGRRAYLLGCAEHNRARWRPQTRARMTSPSTGARIALFADRGVVRVAGEDASKLLQGVITSDMDLLSAQPAIHAALLTPQGKILFDFFVVKVPEGFLLETAADKAAELAKRLTMYKLRAKAEIQDRSVAYRVFAGWGAAPS